MNKILKTSLTIVGILFFCILLKSGVKLYNVIGVVGLYGSIYYFMTLNSEGIENFYLKEIMTILISFNLQKVEYILHKEVYKNKLFLYTNIVMICFFCVLFIYNLFKDKKISLKNVLDLVYEFLIINIPFCVVRGRGTKLVMIFILIFTLKQIYNKEIIFDKNLKNIYISIIFLILFSTTSFIGNDITDYKIDHYINYTKNLLFLLLFFQIKFSNDTLRKILYVGISTSLLRIIPIIILFLKNGNFSFRVGYENPNVWALEAVLCGLIFLYSILFEKKREYIIMYLLYILGLYLSGSRGGVLSFLITNLILLIYKYRSKLKILTIIGILGVGIIFVVLNTNNRISNTYKLIKNEKKLDNSSKIRLIIYKEAFEQFKIKPINGIGFEGYREFSIKRHEKEFSQMSYIEQNAYTQWHTHNNLLDILSSTGILGFIAYISTLYFILKKIYVSKKNEIKTLVILMILAYEICGLVDASTHYYDLQLFLYFIIGLYLAYMTPKISFLKKEKSE